MKTLDFNKEKFPYISMAKVNNDNLVDQILDENGFKEKFPLC